MSASVDLRIQRTGAKAHQSLPIQPGADEKIFWTCYRRTKISLLRVG